MVLKCSPTSMCPGTGCNMSTISMLLKKEYFPVVHAGRPRPYKGALQNVSSHSMNLVERARHVSVLDGQCKNSKHTKR